jgi:imidazolonepropionase-like amidohydrolase
MTGITQIVAAPSGAGIAGQGSAVSLDGWTVEEMVIDPSVYMAAQGPSLQTRGFDRATFTVFNRSFREAKEAYDEAIANLESLLEEARRYDAAGVGADVLRRDLKLEALARVTRGQLPMLISVDDARGIRDAVEFGERNGVRVIIAGGAESPEVAEMLAEKGIPVILGPTQAMPPGPDDAYDAAYARPAKLHAAGVKFALSTFDASSARTLPFEIASGVPYGLPHEEALKAITLYPAQIRGLDDRLGSIEPGKPANLASVKGDPLEGSTTATGRGRCRPGSSSRPTRKREGPAPCNNGAGPSSLR